MNESNNNDQVADCEKELDESDLNSPAFPSIQAVMYRPGQSPGSVVCQPVQSYLGMKLEDYFAAAAMQGDWASQTSSLGMFQYHASLEDLGVRAELYYRMAKAMMNARKK